MSSRLSKILDHLSVSNEHIKSSNTNNISSMSFKIDGIIPDVVDNEPNELLMVSYDSNINVTAMGEILTPSQVKNKPINLTFNGCENNKQYTIILTDPDARDRQKHEFREWIHCVRINVPGYDLTNGGKELIEYVGSGPPPNTGLHRYVWLVYEQNGYINVANCGQKPLKSAGSGGAGRANWKVRKFCKYNNLKNLVAGTYYNAEYDDYVPKLYAWLQGK
eukprot:378656_1